MGLYILIFFIVAAIWAGIGYSKGAPHGLAKEGMMYSMLGIWGLRKLDRLIDERARQARRETALGGTVFI